MIYKYILLFFFYSFLGWSMEVLLTYMGSHKFVNRGFLIGPVCPIYGFACLFITLFLSKYQDDPIVLFIMALATCSIIEYFTSYFMEKLFHARWWDYSNKKYNINGRVCLEYMIVFGLLGSLVVYLINPFVFSIFNLFPDIIIDLFTIIIITIFIIDNFISFKIINSINLAVLTLKKDNTEEITKKVRELLTPNNYFIRRLMKAFPDFSILKGKSKEKKFMNQKQIKRHARKLKRAEKTIEKELKKDKKSLKKIKK